MLYLVATPIGNLSDMTYRAIDILKTCDYILCEDTRHSQSLLNHYGIHKLLKSYHKFNEAKTEDEIIHDLQSGKIIALISDAGTPGICDPGSRLVKECVALNIPVTAIPGACAAIHALSCSGLDTDRFQFIGFLPRKQNELKHLFAEILSYMGTTVCYESPHRLISALECLYLLSPERPIVIARELTKKFEEILRGSVQELLGMLKDRTIKGEIVLLISGKTEEAGDEWKNFSIQEHVGYLQNTYHLSLTEAIKLAAKLRGSSRKEVYREIHSLDVPKKSDPLNE